MRYLTRVRHDLPILVGSTILLLKNLHCCGSSPNLLLLNLTFLEGPYLITVLDPPSVTENPCQKHVVFKHLLGKEMGTHKEFAIKFTYLTTSLAKEAMNMGIYPLVN